MKKGVVIYKNSYNIGDDIQCLAALRLLNDPETVVLDRENLHLSDDNGPVSLLCNGWFMDQPEHWPPASHVHPFFISFHVAKYQKVRNALLRQSLKSYYDQFAPIGCRDHLTVSLFREKGIEAYFSGCATLTLDPFDIARNDDIIVTDPFINDILPTAYAKEVTYKLIPEAYHSQVKLRTHVRESNEVKVEQRLMDAENLLREYAQAKMVITSRIHCALPCLALGTPVYFIDFGYVRPSNRNRFEGILDLMHVVKPILPFHENRRRDKVLKMFNFHKLFKNSIRPLDIDWDNPKPNKNDYQALAAQIRKRVGDHFQSIS